MYAPGGAVRQVSGPLVEIIQLERGLSLNCRVVRIASVPPHWSMERDQPEGSSLPHVTAEIEHRLTAGIWVEGLSRSYCWHDAGNSQGRSQRERSKFHEFHELGAGRVERAMQQTWQLCHECLVAQCCLRAGIQTVEDLHGGTVDLGVGDIPRVQVQAERIRRRLIAEQRRSQLIGCLCNVGAAYSCHNNSDRAQLGDLIGTEANLPPEDLRSRTRLLQRLLPIISDLGRRDPRNKSDSKQRAASQQEQKPFHDIDLPYGQDCPPGLGGYGSAKLAGVDQAPPGGRPELYPAAVEKVLIR